MYGRSEKTLTLKRKCSHFDEIFITGCTESCHFDNFRCSQWWRFRQNEDISVSVHWAFLIIVWNHWYSRSLWWSTSNFVKRVLHDGAMTWKRIPYYWTCVREINWSPVDAPPPPPPPHTHTHTHTHKRVSNAQLGASFIIIEQIIELSVIWDMSICIYIY